MVSENSLVLYKSAPARVLVVADKIEIELAGGKTKRVRPKDVILLHPGPLRNLRDLTPCTGELEAAWELLAGGTTQLGELADLVYGEHTPRSAWATWQLIADGLYFSGTPAHVSARAPAAVAQELEMRAAKAAERSAREAFLQRAREGRWSAADEPILAEVERLATNKSTTSRAVRGLELPETAESAHRLLLRLGYWSEATNPYPARNQLELRPPELALPALPTEPRRDLTHLPAFAIDDEGNVDPDDAISVEGNRLWVHVADVAALIAPNSPADQEARARGANVYLPEGTTPMLPAAATSRLGLGLQEVSAALSFGIDLDPQGAIDGVEIVPSQVRVQRLSYSEATARLSQPPLAQLQGLVNTLRERRRAAGALFIDLPEVSIQVEAEAVTIRPLPPLAARAMVSECMLAAGAAAAQYALEHAIPVPFSTQAAPPPESFPPTPSGMYAQRRRLQRSQARAVPLPHAGLGLNCYTQATSPLRRYLDLVAHQQLRAHLSGAALLSEAEIVARIGSAVPGVDLIRATERAANRHWTLVYLLRQPNWQGTGILVDRNEERGTVIIEQLGLEARVRARGEPPLDSRLEVELTSVDLPALTAHFRVRG